MDIGNIYRSTFSVKTCVIGPQGVGKTSIVLQLDSKYSKKPVSPTVGATFICKVIDVDTYTLRYQLWDTAGQEAYRSMLPMYYRKTNCALVVFDLTDAESFYSLPGWVNELERCADKDVVLCVVGNKTDLAEDRVIGRRQASEFAKSIGALYVETSAKENEGIEEIFELTSRQLINLYQRRGSLVYDMEGEPLIKSLNVQNERKEKKTKKCC